MKQPVKNGKTIKRKKNIHRKKRIKHEDYGTSKLEVYFAKNFLDKLGLTYVYEYEAKDIKRFYDFAIIPDDETLITEERNGILSVNDKTRDVNPLLIIEIDGSYWHSDPRVVDVNNLNAMQKHNKKIDEIKNKWCGEHHIPILRIWEYDIYNNPEDVRKLVAENSVKYAKKYIKLKNKYKNPKNTIGK